MAKGNIVGIGMGSDEKKQMKSDAAPDYNGMNFNNLQHKFNNLASDNSTDMDWEKKNGVFHDPSGTFKDKDMQHVHEVDLTKHVEVAGMPFANHNHNTSTDCYGS